MEFKWRKASGYGQGVVGCGGLRRGRVKRRPDNVGVRLTEAGVRLVDVAG